jgi:hypothetical protein
MSTKNEKDGFVTLEELERDLKKIPGMAEKIEAARQPAWQGAVRGLAVIAIAIPVIILLYKALQAFGLLSQ